MEFPLLTIRDAFCIALIIALICIVPTVASERFRPKVYPVQVREVVIKIQDRIIKEKT